jgi:NAD-dependent DNA ligase
LTSREDARRFLPFLTLVPIRTAGLNIGERQTEIEFLNKYFSTDVDMKYAIMRGDYNQLLFQVKRFVDDAETLRPYMPFLYDGVVVSLIDPYLIGLIGRYKSVNKWSIAIKFEAEVKQTIFLGYDFTIGQNGVVTPMARIRPVAFMGNIQSKISVHSYKRFKQLGLKVGDTVTVEFRHDVMAYLTKPDTPYNRSNPNPVIEFPTHCPFCGAPLSTVSEKEAVCVNKLCPERNLMRVTNMLAKLNIKDFGKEMIRKLGITSLRDFITYDCNKAEQILNSKVMAMKLHARIEELYKKPMPDYRLMGAIGFTSIAQSKWKLILSQVSVEAILRMDENELRNTLKAIKGIGSVAADTIASERAYMYNDIVMIANMPCVERTYGRVDTRVQVRFTGVRDAELEELFNSKGFDADGTKGVTKKTMILVVPYVGFQSSKTQKANPNCAFMDPTMARNYLNSIR